MNHSLLLVCRKKPEYIYALELTFDASNFQHLTGLQTNHSRISPTDFFERCITRRLKEDDLSFATDGTTPLKLQVLPMLLVKNLSANMVGDYNGRNPKLITDKLAGEVYRGVWASSKYQADDMFLTLYLKAELMIFPKKQIAFY